LRDAPPIETLSAAGSFGSASGLSVFASSTAILL
jgi:hypothetical protein